ncbi:MAG: DUF2203 family protein [Planctomycetota bacterium]|jgi:hypothetical protein
MGPRVFTVREANRLIPKLDEIFQDLDLIREKLKRIKGKIDILEMIWGEEIESETNPDRREYSHYSEEAGKIKEEFEAVTRRFADTEVHLKSVDAGLVDFYSVLEGRLVFLCWKRGEKAVEWYHRVDEGFAERKRIPARELTE